MSSFTNKFALLSEVSDKKRQVVVSDGLVPRKSKKPSEKKDQPEPSKQAAPAKPAAAAPVAAAAKPKKAAPAGADSNAPTNLKDAIAFNKQKAEAAAAKAAAEKAAAEKAAAERAEKLAAEKAAAEQAAAEKAAAGEATADGAAPAEGAAPAPVEEKKKDVAVVPPKPVKTLAEVEKERAEAHFTIGAKQARNVDAGAVKNLAKLSTNTDELVIAKPKEAPKPAAKTAAKGKAPAAAAAPAKEKKDKVEKIELKDFADFSAPARGRGRGAGFRGGRGGYQAAERVPNLEDNKAFPTLA